MAEIVTTAVVANDTSSEKTKKRLRIEDGQEDDKPETKKFSQNLTVDKTVYRIESSFVGGGIVDQDFVVPHDTCYHIMDPVKKGDDFTLSVDLSAWDARLAKGSLVKGLCIHHSFFNFYVASPLRTYSNDEIQTRLFQLEYGSEDKACSTTVTTKVGLSLLFKCLFKSCEYSKTTGNKIVFLPKLYKNKQHICLKQDLTFIDPVLVIGFELDKVSSTRNLGILTLVVGKDEYRLYLKSYSFSR